MNFQATKEKIQDDEEKQNDEDKEKGSINNYILESLEALVLDTKEEEDLEK